MKRFTQFINEADTKTPPPLPEWNIPCICHGCDSHVTVKANRVTLEKKPCPVCKAVGWLEDLA